MRTYGVGVIGAGFMGKTHTFAYANMPLFFDGHPFKVKLVGICNRTLSKAERLKDEYGYEFATSDYRDLLERKDIHIIDVCTPNNVHHEQILASLGANKHVYADKPLCITDSEAEDIVGAARKAGVVHMTAFHNRFFPAIMKLKMLMDEGFFGEVISFRVGYYHSSNLDPGKFRGWRQSMQESGGGVLYDMGSHALDLIYHLLGEYARMSMQSMILYPERPDAEGGMTTVETEDHVLVTAKMKGGGMGTLEVSKVIVGSNDDLDLDIYGTLGAARFRLMHPSYLQIYDTREPEGAIGGRRGYKSVETLNKDPGSKSNFPGPRFAIGWLRGHIGSQFHFLKCVHENRPAVPTLADGAYIQKIMNRLYSISNSGQWVEL
jgi:predicted dehydrogenase